MNDTDKKRLEEAEQYAKRSRENAEACGFKSSVDADRVFFLISHLKESTERESGVRELHKRDECCNGNAACQRDGILQAWDAPTIYVNPPYGRTIKHWVKKARTAARAGSRVIMLVPARTCSDWFHGAMSEATDVLFIRRRLKFNDQGPGFSDNAPFPSVLLGFNADLTPIADLGTRVARLNGAALGNQHDEHREARGAASAPKTFL